MTVQARLKEMAVSGLLLGVKFGIALLITGTIILWALGDYTQTRAAAVYLSAPTGMTDAKGKLLTRMDLLDALMRDAVQRQQAAATLPTLPAPTAPLTK